MTIRVLSHDEARARLSDEWAEPPVPFLTDQGRTRLEAFIKDNHAGAHTLPLSAWEREAEDQAKILGPGGMVITKLKTKKTNNRRPETLGLPGKCFDWTLTTHELEPDNEPPSPAPV